MKDDDKLHTKTVFCKLDTFTTSCNDNMIKSWYIVFLFGVYNNISPILQFHFDSFIIRF